MVKRHFPWQLSADIPLEPEVVRGVVIKTDLQPQCGTCNSDNLDELLANCQSVENDHPNEADCVLLPHDEEEVDTWLRRVLHRDGLVDGSPTGELEVIVS